MVALVASLVSRAATLSAEVRAPAWASETARSDIASLSSIILDRGARVLRNDQLVCGSLVDGALSGRDVGLQSRHPAFQVVGAPLRLGARAFGGCELVRRFFASCVVRSGGLRDRQLRAKRVLALAGIRQLGHGGGGLGLRIRTRRLRERRVELGAHLRDLIVQLGLLALELGFGSVLGGDGGLRHVKDVLLGLGGLVPGLLQGVGSRRGGPIRGDCRSAVAVGVEAGPAGAERGSSEGRTRGVGVLADAAPHRSRFRVFREGRGGARRGGSGRSRAVRLRVPHGGCTMARAIVVHQEGRLRRAAVEPVGLCDDHPDRDHDRRGDQDRT